MAAAAEEPIDERTLLDEILIDYLSSFDVYQASQGRLQATLKDAYFDLARSKLALGASKMSANGYDLSESWSNIAVSIASNLDSSSTNNNSPLEIQEYGSAIFVPSPSYSFSLGPAPAPPLSPQNSDPECTPNSTTLRSRSGAPKNEEPKPLIKMQEAPNKPPRLLQRSPLLQFSAFPPTPLRQAEKSWQSVLRATIELTEAKVRVEEMEKKVRECKSRIGGMRDDGGSKRSSEHSRET